VCDVLAKSILKHAFGVRAFILITYDFFSVAECVTIEVFFDKSANSDFESTGLYARTDNRASAPTKKSTWRHINNDRTIYYDGSAKEWRLGYKEQQNTDDYLYSSNQIHYT
jgi:hypothetical protein